MKIFLYTTKGNLQHRINNIDDLPHPIVIVSMVSRYCFYGVTR